MTVLTAIQDVATVIGIEQPTAVYSSAAREHIELAALANEMADRIAKSHEWELLNKITTYTGDGSTEDFDLPSDYDRMLKKANIWSSSLETPLRHITSRDEWLGLDIQSFDFVINAWIKYSGQIHIKPALASSVTAKHFYQSNLIVQNEGGDNQTSFTADSDTFRLSERLLELGIVWQWKANKGFAYEEDLATYEDLRETLSSDDKGSRIIHLGRRRIPKGVTIAYPQTITP